MESPGGTDRKRLGTKRDTGFVPPELPMPDPITLEYQRLENLPIRRVPRRPSFGVTSVSLFTVTVLLFLGALAMTDSDRENDPAPFVALSSLLTSFAGLIAGIIGLWRGERRSELAKFGITLNGLWLFSCGALIGIAQSIFGGMTGSDFH